jgi:hypothetical protein
VLVIHVVDPAVPVGWLREYVEFPTDAELLVVGAETDPAWCPAADLFEAPETVVFAADLNVQPCEIAFPDHHVVVRCGEYALTFGIVGITPPWGSFAAVIEGAYHNEALAPQ